MGPFVAVTTPHTGRSPNDKFVVKEPSSEKDVDWGKVNQPISPEKFELLLADVRAYLERARRAVRRRISTAAPTRRIACRCATCRRTRGTWRSCGTCSSARSRRELPTFDPNFTVLHAPEFQADPARHGTRTGTFIVLNLAERMILIGGTRYAGELKKSMFTVMNYLPAEAGRALHALLGEHRARRATRRCSSGSPAPARRRCPPIPIARLIGDDEHGWSARRHVQLRGRLLRQGDQPLARGRARHLSHDADVRHDPRERRARSARRSKVKFEDQSITENTRASYPLHYIPNHVPSGRGGHPKNVVFLTADAFGVLPPIARLTREQAMYYFLSGYTAKVAGTERGVTEPQATFSACFGAVFLVWHPTKYAEMLGELLERARLAACGWSTPAGAAAPYGVGKRMKLALHARDGARGCSPASSTTSATRDRSGLRPRRSRRQVTGVPTEVLRSARARGRDTAAYDAQAKKLAGMFRENFEKFGSVDPAIKNAGPKG